MTVQRIRLSRAKGWRKPTGAVMVARPSRWGNPFTVAEHGVNGAVARYRERLGRDAELRTQAVTELRGRDLACWCPLDAPCHADLLITVANTDNPCRVCLGSGEVAIPITSRRTRPERPASGQQIGLCLTCLGTGTKEV